MVLFGLFVLFFYNSVMGLPASLVGAAVFLGLAFDALIDPYIGYLSDGCRHPMGRRHIFMLPGAIALGPCFFLLFSPPRSLGPAGLFLWLMGTWLAVRVSGAVYRIPYLSMGAELCQDYDDRTTLFAIRGLFGLIGTALAAGLSFLVFFPPNAGGVDSKLSYDAYPRLGIAFGAVITAAGILGTMATVRYRTLGDGGARAFSPRDFFHGAGRSLRNRSFRQIWWSFVLFFLAVVFNASVAVNYFTWYARIGESRYLSAIQAAFYLGALLGVFAWIALARRSEKRSIYIFATLPLALLMFLATALVGPGHLLGTGNVMALIAGHALAGVFASAVWVIPPAMAADVVDQDQLETGLRREGMYFGILNLGEKLAAGGALLFSGVLLNLFGALSGVPGGSTEHAPAKPIFIGMLYGAIPAIILTVAALVLLPYHLDRRTLQSIQDQLRGRGLARDASVP
jgi:GPH family glycoside/pentoside/hexuronide:cation symporter